MLAARENNGVPSELGKGVRDRLSNKVTLKLRQEVEGPAIPGGGERAVQAVAGAYEKASLRRRRAARMQGERRQQPMPQGRVSWTTARDFTPGSKKHHRRARRS